MKNPSYLFMSHEILVMLANDRFIRRFYHFHESTQNHLPHKNFTVFVQKIHLAAMKNLKQFSHTHIQYKLMVFCVRRRVCGYLLSSRSAVACDQWDSGTGIAGALHPTLWSLLAFEIGVLIVSTRTFECRTFHSVPRPVCVDICVCRAERWCECVGWICYWVLPCSHAGWRSGGSCNEQSAWAWTGQTGWMTYYRVYALVCIPANDQQLPHYHHD